MLERVRSTVGSLPREILADAGALTTEFVICADRAEHGRPIPAVPRGRLPANATVRERMARQSRTKNAPAVSATRKTIVNLMKPCTVRSSALLAASAGT
jgi:hypothetical protein